MEHTVRIVRKNISERGELREKLDKENWQSLREPEGPKLKLSHSETIAGDQRGLIMSSSLTSNERKKYAIRRN